ncbi:hypothetical protein TPAR_08266 [Tolypocladium paradoxum]|uniref:Uncharacterized protein n=1 Tax=Tolypocladium paradoxum TaxID=94208 RepID=A0A2S4KMX7_9HYPO|nr:hypothetical protein TPAR_08266 [Tolypocladium paradoxum]
MWGLSMRMRWSDSQISNVPPGLSRRRYSSMNSWRWTLVVARLMSLTMTRSNSSVGNGHGIWRRSWLTNCHFMSWSGFAASAGTLALPGDSGAMSMPVKAMPPCPRPLKYRWHIMLQKPEPHPISSTRWGGLFVSDGEHTGAPKSWINSSVRRDWRCSSVRSDGRGYGRAVSLR